MNQSDNTSTMMTESHSIAEYMGDVSEQFLIPDPQTEKSREMLYRNIGVAKFVAAPYFKDIWGKLLVRYGYASFSDVLTAVCGADGDGVPEGWEMQGPHYWSR